MPRFQTQDGVELFYKDWGTGQPVVLLSSWLLNSDMWELQFASLLGAGYRVIALDRRGHGRSDQPGGGYDMDTLAADVDALFRALDLRDAVLVGQSMGGAEAVRYLSRYGTDRVSRLVGIGATLPFMEKTDDHPLGGDRCAMLGSIELLSRDRFAWMEMGLPGFYGDSVPVSPLVQNWLVGMTASCGHRAMVECQRTAAFTDLRPDLPGISIPSLLIVGSEDQSTSVELNREAVGLLPNGRLSVYEGVAHALYLTHAERLNEELVGFISERL